MEKAKYGKMRQVTALNGSQMVVKIGVVYYRVFSDNIPHCAASGNSTRGEAGRSGHEKDHCEETQLITLPFPFQGVPHTRKTVWGTFYALGILGVVINRLTCAS